MTHHHHHHHCPVHGCQECTCYMEHDVCCHEEHDHHHDHEDFSQQLLDMADEAWMEVLKEKIKEHIRTSSGKQLDELSKLVSESNKDRWMHKLATQKTGKHFKEKIAEFFGREKG